MNIVEWYFDLDFFSLNKLWSLSNRNSYFYVACREWYFIKIAFKPCTISLILCWPKSVYDDLSDILMFSEMYNVHKHNVYYFLFMWYSIKYCNTINYMWWKYNCFCIILYRILIILINTYLIIKYNDQFVVL